MGAALPRKCVTADALAAAVVAAGVLREKTTNNQFEDRFGPILFF